MLTALLDTLLPGDPDWPSAGSLDGMAVEEAAPILAELPADFAAGDEETLRAVEAAHPGAFERLVSAVYLAYYTHPTVRAVLERVTGYEARPPQPMGYELPPFEESLLETQRKRAPFWRQP